MGVREKWFIRNNGIFEIIVLNVKMEKLVGAMYSYFSNDS